MVPLGRTLARWPPLRARSGARLGAVHAGAAGPPQRGAALASSHRHTAFLIYIYIAACVRSLRPGSTPQRVCLPARRVPSRCLPDSPFAQRGSVHEDWGLWRGARQPLPTCMRARVACAQGDAPAWRGPEIVDGCDDGFSPSPCRSHRHLPGAICLPPTQHPPRPRPKAPDHPASILQPLQPRKHPRPRSTQPTPTHALAHVFAGATRRRTRAPGPAPR